MNANRRFLVLAIAAVLLVVGWFGVRQYSSPNYVQLFPDMDLAQTSTLKDALTKAAIPNELNAVGQVMVPQADIARARVALAKEGLPLSGRPGLELFDKQTWGMTDFTQRVTYRRALEGELARTIGTLRGVQKAQVSLALPDAAPLRKLDRAATASVVVSMRAGDALSADQVRGIAQLVSSSVERLPLENVAVIDDSGRPLTAVAGNESGPVLTSRQLELQQQIEKRLADKAEAMIITALGPGTARVQVAAQLNFAQAEQTSEVYDTAGKVLSNEQRSTGGDSSTVGGAQTILNNTYVNSRRVDKLISETGNIKRLTVAVMVDSAALGETSQGFVMRRQQLDTLVRNAVGADSARGDLVSVVPVAFEKPPVAPVVAPDSATKTPLREVVRDFGMPVIGLIAVLSAVALAIIALRPKKTVVVPTALGSVATTGDLPIASPTPGGLEMRDRAQAELTASPEAAARAIRAWLTDAA